MNKIIAKLKSLLRLIGYNIGRCLAFIGHVVENIRERREIVSPRSVLITGASSGIGAELARQYAAPGVFLYLTGRDATRLNKVAVDCMAQGAKVETQIMDICDDVSVEKWIKDLPRVDLLIANAGVSGGTAEGIDNDEIREIFSVNVGGVLSAVLPMIEKARKQALVEGLRGHIAVVSSMASMRPLPSAPAYAASKACVASYADALRGSLKHEKILVSTIGPGYIRTPMTETNQFFMPLIMNVDKAAYKIRKGLWKRKSRIFFPRPIYYALRFINILPLWLTDPIFRRMPQKA